MRKPDKGVEEEEKERKQSFKNMFFLPESMAFILTNSIDCSNGITNINNNINIYNTNNVDLNSLNEQAKNAY